MTPRESLEPHTLGTALAVLRGEYSERPPEHLEAVLRARFLERRRSKAARRWGLCIAAAGAVAAIIFWLLPLAGQQAPRKVATVPVAMDATPERLPAVREQPVHVVHRPAKPPHNRRVAAVRESVPEPADFLALPYAEPLLASEPINVYRVQLPRVTLTHFGLPVRPGTLDSTVTAELVVGSDGVARAIRFVQ